MRISKKWLQDFVDIPAKLSPEKLENLITTRIVEVNEVIDIGRFLEGVVVGQIVAIANHPNADKLHVCHVEIKNQKSKIKNQLQIVCGGSNIREGMKVAVGLAGAKVRWHGQGEWISLQETEIRGIKSYGMICAADEIGLVNMFPKKEEKEILDLTPVDAKSGTPLAAALGLDDIIFDIDNKSLSSRPDLWGHYGLARELAALFQTKLKARKILKIRAGNDIKLRVAVRDKKGCPRYTGVILDGITIEPSPEWLQRRLRSVGQRPINNIVDITNYVMFELAQPTHAFDVQKLAMRDKELKVVVEWAKAGERFVTLDGVERALTNEMLVIADREKSLALAGVMGGSHTGMSGATTTVLFESANFDAVTVRKMSQKLGLRTEGSARWEKWQDPENAAIGLRRLVELTQAVCPTARVVSNIVDTGLVKLTQGPISLPMSFVYKKIGVEIGKKQVASILTRLGFGVKIKFDQLSVTIPTWRATHDISITEDLVEEVARIYGYENIPATMPRFAIVPGRVNPLRDLEHKVKELLAYEFGYTEMYNYSFESPEWLSRLGEDTSEYLVLDNPVANDRPLVRERMIPNLLMNVEANLHRFDRVALFEIGRVFLGKEHGEFADHKKRERLPKQSSFLGLVYAAKGDEAPFFVASEAVRGVFTRLGIYARIEKYTATSQFMHGGRFAEIKVGDAQVGLIGELHPAVQARAGIPYRVAMVEVALENLLACKPDQSQYEPLPAYPAVARDIAFTVKRQAEHADIIQAIRNVNLLIERVELFDVYDGQSIALGKKSLAYHLTYRSHERTLAANKVEQVHTQVGNMLAKKFGAEMRK